MNALSQMNEAMEYIEDNLTSEIDYLQIARLSGCSEYHFRRMFSFLSGMSLGEYIRLRRLSHAASIIKASEIKIIDIAIMMGYDSPDAFTKAFKEVHGVTPTQIRKEDVALKMFSPMTFQLIIKGGSKMEYRIVEKEGFKIVGFKKRVDVVFNGINPQMESLNKKLTPEVIHELKSLSNIEPKGILSISANFSERTVEGSQVDQYIGIATSAESIKGEYEVLDVNPYSWAVFTVVGEFPTALQETWARIYGEWLPTSDYELTGGPEIVWNESPDTEKPNYKSEIWIPVIKK